MRPFRNILLRKADPDLFKSRFKESVIDIGMDLLSTTEKRVGSSQQTVDTISSFYDKLIYSYCIFDYVTIEDAARKLNGSTEMADSRLLRFFVPPRSAISRPQSFALRIGEARFTELSTVLAALLLDHDEMEVSVSQCSMREGCSASTITSFFRALAMCTEISHPLATQAAFVIEDLRNVGCVGDSFYIDGDFHDRTISIARLLFSTAEEFGSNDLLKAGIELLRQSGRDVDYETSKRITRCVMRSDRRALDWSAKSTASWKTKKKTCKVKDKG